MWVSMCMCQCFYIHESVPPHDNLLTLSPSQVPYSNLVFVDQKKNKTRAIVMSYIFVAYFLLY